MTENNGMKWYTYIICGVLIFFGVYFGIRFWKDVTAESYVNGSITASNVFETDEFSYSATVINYYAQNDGSYAFNTSTLPVTDFNGAKYSYKVLFNGNQILNADIKAGEITFSYRLNFYNTDGSLIIEGITFVNVTFLADSTNLSLSVENYEQSAWFNSYFGNEGFSLKVVRAA